MASLYECEVRFLIEDISAFEKRLDVLGAGLIYPYEFNLKIPKHLVRYEPLSVIFSKQVLGFL